MCACSVMDSGLVEYCYRDHQLIPVFACCSFCMSHAYWAHYRLLPLCAVFRLDFNESNTRTIRKGAPSIVEKEREG